MNSIENIFKKIVNENFKHTSYNNHFNGLNYMDINHDDHIFNLTLEKKDDSHYAIIVWGLAHKSQLNGTQTQFHGEHYKIITKKISKSEMIEKILTLIKESFERNKKI